MMTLSKSEEKKLRRAGAKAKAEKPLVRKTDRYNVWLVRSSDKSTFYTVTFTKGDKPGEIKADCTCANASKKNHNCKHPMAAYGLYKQAVIERAKARLCSEGCEAPTVEGETLCSDCLEASELSRVAQLRHAEAVAMAPTLIECKECHDFCPSADMLSETNPVCPSCVLFG